MGKLVPERQNHSGF